MADSTTAQIGSQSEFEYWDTNASPDAWAPLGLVRTMDPYGADLPEVNSTTLDSDEEEFIPGLPMGKELSITLTLTADSLARVERINTPPTVNIDVRVIYPAPTSQTRYFSVTPRGFDGPVHTPSGLMEITFKGRRTGAASVTPSHP